MIQDQYNKSTRLSSKTRIYQERLDNLDLSQKDK
jgi:hypothetical protein